MTGQMYVPWTKVWKCAAYESDGGEGEPSPGAERRVVRGGGRGARVQTSCVLVPGVHGREESSFCLTSGSGEAKAIIIGSEAKTQALHGTCFGVSGRGGQRGISQL